MSDRQHVSGQGRIPFRLRIGVTGHRRLDDEQALAGQVRRALARIRELAPSSPYTPVFLTAISPLAEGADRLVAKEVLKEPEAELEAPLPLRREEYLHDFESVGSKREFEDLLSRAREVMELASSGSREEAYQRVGRYIVDRCDVLVALWDGRHSSGPGGTAEIVAYAREHHVPLLWIAAKGRYEIVEELGRGIGRSVFRELDQYNSAAIVEERFDQQVSDWSHQLLAKAEPLGACGMSMRGFLAWVSPYFVRADLLAERYQGWYYALYSTLFLLAAAAVAAASGQELFAPDRPELLWIEVGLMLGLLTAVWVGRRGRLHERWIAYRFLAERFRSAFFLALAGLGSRRQGGLERVHLGEPSEEWLRRSFGEVWNRRPQAEMIETNMAGLRRFLADAWIEDQLRYHRSTGRKHERRHLRLSRGTEFLFVATVLVAILLAVEVGGPGTDALLLLAISMPALGAALSGIRAQREYQRNSERCGRTVHYLENVRERMDAAPSLEAVRTVAAEAEELMLEENRDWFVVMRFHDFELQM